MNFLKLCALSIIASSTSLFGAVLIESTLLISYPSTQSSHELHHTITLQKNESVCVYEDRDVHINMTLEQEFDEYCVVSYTSSMDAGPDIASIQQVSFSYDTPTGSILALVSQEPHIALEVTTQKL